MWADGEGEISTSQLGDAFPSGLMPQARSLDDSSEMRPQGLRGVLVVVVALAAVSWPVWRGWRTRGVGGCQVACVARYFQVPKPSSATIASTDLHLMARTKETARKYPAGKPPDPRQGQQYKLTQPIVKKRRRMSDEDRPRIEESEEEEQEDEQQEEQEEEAEGEDDEDEIGTLELFRMIRASETRDHNGPWCTEMAKIPYAHISNANFREKEDLCFHIQVENKWKPLGIAAFMEDRSNNVDQIGVFCEFWD
ncbi:hypothetical protein R1sor_002394 [Riccia sorocarpa]|uniref:Uncharacterized protein n=1 Tax=Riccia sorocarpa TaxID=122646 RepID=A0ABD3H1B4_9MARC